MGGYDVDISKRVVRMPDSPTEAAYVLGDRKIPITFVSDREFVLAVEGGDDVFTATNFIAFGKDDKLKSRCCDKEQEDPKKYTKAFEGNHNKIPHGGFVGRSSHHVLLHLYSEKGENQEK